MSDYLDKAKQYLIDNGAFGKDGKDHDANMYGDLIGRSVMEILGLMSQQGHSGGSWSTTLQALIAADNEAWK